MLHAEFPDTRSLGGELALNASKARPLVLALDLEGTLISDQFSLVPRPGLFEFLEFSHRSFRQLVMYTYVFEKMFRKIATELIAKGAAPRWFDRMEYLDWSGEYKDLKLIPGARVDRTVLVDDDEEMVRPEQKNRWISILPYEPPYSDQDRELERVQVVLEREWGCGSVGG